MDTDSLEEDGLTIEQQLPATRFDGAEAYLILDNLLTQPNLHLIKLGIFGRP